MCKIVYLTPLAKDAFMDDIIEEAMFMAVLDMQESLNKGHVEARILLPE